MSSEHHNYYMLRVEGKGFPTKEHADRDTAIQEAERLCNKEKRPVDLLVAVARCCPKPEPEPETTVKILARLATSTDVSSKIDEAMDRLSELQDLVDAAYDILKIKPHTEMDYDLPAALNAIREFREAAAPFVTK